MKKYIILLLTMSQIVFGQVTLSDSVKTDTVKYDTVKSIETTVITYQADMLIPVTYQNISAQEIKIKSLGEEPSFLLSETPSITNYSDAGSGQGYSYFRLRGIDQTRINISLDGVPLNEPEDQGAYFSNYPDILNSTNGIQIQRGIGVTKNGTASFGGGIQLTAPNLYDSTCTIGLSYGSFNSLRAFGEFSTGVRNNKALYVRMSDINSSGYKYNSSNNSQSVYIHSGLFHKKSVSKLTLLFGQQQNELAWLGVADSLIQIDRRTNANKNESDQFVQSLAQIQNIWTPTASSTIHSSIYYTYLKGNYDFNLDNLIPNSNVMYNYALQSHLIGFFGNYTLRYKHLDWTTGIHGNTYRRQHIGSEATAGQLYTNTGFKTETSIFSKANYTIKNITLFTDIQYKYSNFDYRGDTEFNKIHWNFLNPKAGLSYAIQPNSVIYYSIGKTSREPTRTDMFQGNDNLVDTLFSNIIPESVIDHELGIRLKSKKLQFNLNLFYMSFKNEIVLDGKFGPNSLALTNQVDKSIRSGVELNAIYVTKRIRFETNAAFNHAKIKEQTIEFTPILTPKIIWNQSVSYSYKYFIASISARRQSSGFIDFANTAQVNAYTVLNAYVAYTFKHIQFALHVNNITNTKYYNNGYVDGDKKYYFVQAPTNLFISIKWIL